MARRQRATYEVRRPEQIEAMKSPVRLEILDAARVLGSCSIAEIAEIVGRTPDSLYYHVDKLARVGLLIPNGARKTERRDEQLYITPGKRLRLPHDPSDPELTELRLDAFGALLRIADRDHRAAFEHGLARVRGARRNIVNARVKGWLNDEELAEVREAMEHILSVFESAKVDRAGRNLHAVTLFLTPIQPKSRER